MDYKRFLASCSANPGFILRLDAFIPRWYCISAYTYRSKGLTSTQTKMGGVVRRVNATEPNYYINCPPVVDLID